jgi:hypothetical protein
VAQCCHPSYSGGINRRIIIQPDLGKDPIPKITKAKGLRVWLKW